MSVQDERGWILERLRAPGSVRDYSEVLDRLDELDESARVSRREKILARSARTRRTLKAAQKRVSDAIGEKRRHALQDVALRAAQAARIREELELFDLAYPAVRTEKVVKSGIATIRIMTHDDIVLVERQCALADIEAVTIKARRDVAVGYAIFRELPFKGFT